MPRRVTWTRATLLVLAWCWGAGCRGTEPETAPPADGSDAPVTLVTATPPPELVGDPEALFPFVQSPGQPDPDGCARDGEGRLPAECRWWERLEHGYLDATGAVVLPAVYDEAGPFSDGLAVVRGADGYRVIDRTGAVVLPWSGEYRPTISEGAIVARRDLGRRSVPVVHDLQGRSATGVRVEVSVSNVFPLRGGLAAVSSRQRYGWIDRAGRLVVPLAFCSPSETDPGLGLASEGMIAARPELPDGGCGPVGYLSVDGSWAIEPQFAWGGPFREGLARVEDGFIDVEGRRVFDAPLVFDRADPRPGAAPDDPTAFQGFHEGLAAVRAPGGRIGFVDRTGTWAIEPRFAAAHPFSQGVAAVQVEPEAAGSVARWGYVDRQGAWVLTPRYLDARPFRGGVAVVWLDEVPFRFWHPCECPGFRRLVLQAWIDGTGRVLHRAEVPDLGSSCCYQE